MELPKHSQVQSIEQQREVDDGASDDDDGGGRSESCIISSMTEVEVRTGLEKVATTWYANGKDGGYREI